MQPCPQVGTGLKARVMGPGLHQGLLHEIIGAIISTGQRQGKRAEPWYCCQHSLPKFIGDRLGIAMRSRISHVMRRASSSARRTDWAEVGPPTHRKMSATAPRWRRDRSFWIAEFFDSAAAYLFSYCRYGLQSYRCEPSCLNALQTEKFLNCIIFCGLLGPH